jgi:hypothetical protein
MPSRLHVYKCVVSEERWRGEAALALSPYPRGTESWEASELLPFQGSSRRRNVYSPDSPNAPKTFT